MIFAECLDTEIVCLLEDDLSLRGFSKPKEFRAHVQHHPGSLATRVIISTGREDPAVKLTALHSGVVAFFTKHLTGITLSARSERRWQ